MLSVVTIFDRPKDYPDSMVARRFAIGENGTFPTADYCISPTIEPLRAWAGEQIGKFNGTAPYCLGREQLDEPHIVESWV